MRWEEISLSTEINIEGNYARKQQKCKTVISDAIPVVGEDWMTEWMNEAKEMCM